MVQRKYHRQYINNYRLVIDKENVKVPAEKNVKFVHVIKYVKLRVFSPNV